MKAGSLFQTSMVVALVILLIAASADAKKRNKKRPPDSQGRPRDEPRKGSGSPPEVDDTASPSGQNGESATTAVAAKDVPVIEPAVAPEVEVPSRKQKEKHRNRGGKRHRENQDAADTSDTVTKAHKDKASRKKDRAEKKKHHKKHNRDNTMTTTMMMMNEGVNELSDGVVENEPIIMETTIDPMVDGDPLVEPEVEIDEAVEATMITTTTMSSKHEKKPNRGREGKRMRDEAKSDREARKERKEQKKRDKQEKRKHRKNKGEPAQEVELTVNPTPSPVADGIKLTPSGPSPLQTTQQQPQQTEPGTSRKEKKNKKPKSGLDESELSRTEKRIQRLERKMQRMGHKRKNATRIHCEDHEDCQEGQCCLLRRGKKVCHIVNKPEGHHCVHPCMCSEGLTCLGKNRKQKSLSKGHCRLADITEMVGGGAVADNQAPATVDNELPQ